jgi:hypothetical protein
MRPGEDAWLPGTGDPGACGNLRVDLGGIPDGGSAGSFLHSGT